jgi:predicted O-methyltransferase YrrM
MTGDGWEDPILLAEKIEGWMPKEELTWLSGAASRSYRIIEIGSHCGRSAKAMAGSCPGTLVSVDRWPLRENKAKFEANMSQEIASGKVVVIHGNSSESVEAVKNALPGGTADLIFIDADHSYEGVKADVQAYMSLLSPYGMMCGHDANNPRWRGVMKAIMELLPEYRTVCRSIWYWRKGKNV